jgi:LPXTG-motif cell wall-anchored protein
MAGKHRVLAGFVATLLSAVMLLFTVGEASAHTVLVVCDEETGELVWSNVPPPELEVAIVTSNGLTVTIPGGATATTEHPGPGTWVATWTDEETATGDIPPECGPDETTTTTTTSTTSTTSTTTTSSTVPPLASTIVPPPTTASSRTLPSTGSGRSIAAVVGGTVLFGAGMLLTIAARRRTAHS